MAAEQQGGGASPGNLATFLLAVQALTGLVLMFHYRPTVAFATVDLIDLREVSRFGFVRGVHRWGSHAAVIVIWLHLFRAALRGRYRPPRHRDWALGVVLMVLTVLLATTGYLLPWDQEAYWGIAVLSPGEPTAPPMAGMPVAGMASDGGTWGDGGPPSVDGSTLLRFYVLHCVVLPLLVVVLTVVHIRRVRRAGTANPEDPGD